MKVIIPMMNSMKQMMMIEAYEPIETFSGDDKELIEQQPDIDLSLDRWSRPPAAALETVKMQMFYTNYYVAKSTSIIRLFGVTLEAASIAVNMRGFYPYFFIVPNFPAIQINCTLFQNALNNAIIGKKKKSEKWWDRSVCVYRVDVIQGRQSIYGFSEIGEVFLKITLVSPWMMNDAVTVLTSGKFTCPNYPKHKFRTFESNVKYDMRFMIDNGVTGCDWLEICDYVRSENKTTRCQLELDVHFDKIRPLGEQEFGIAPIRILSFDIECKDRPGTRADSTPKLQLSEGI